MKEGIDAVKLLEEGKVIQIKPQGYSMYPMLLPGRDSVLLSKVDQRKLRRGDVVLYRRDSGLLVLHRIWKVTREGVYLIGDNQSTIEGPLKKEQIKGILISFLWRGRMISVRNPIYLLLSRVWLFLRPMRNMIKKAAALLRKGYFFFKAKQ